MVEILRMIIVFRSVFHKSLYVYINYEYQKRFYFERIDLSEGIDVNKMSGSKECDVCHCSYF